MSRTWPELSDDFADAFLKQLQEGYLSKNERAKAVIEKTVAQKPITLGNLSRVFDEMQLDETLTNELLTHITTCKPEDRFKLLEGSMHKIAAALVDEHFHLIPSLQSTFPGDAYKQLVGVKSNTDYEDSNGYTSLEDVLMQATVLAYYANLQSAFDKKLNDPSLSDDSKKTEQIEEFSRTIISPLARYSRDIRLASILNEATFIQRTYNWFSMFLASIRLWPPATVEQRATRLMSALVESQDQLSKYSKGLAEGEKQKALQKMQDHVVECRCAVECVLDTIRTKKECNLDLDENEVVKSITDVCKEVAWSITAHLRPLINEHKAQRSPLALAWEKVFKPEDLSVIKNKLIASDKLIREMAVQGKNDATKNDPR